MLIPELRIPGMEITGPVPPEKCRETTALIDLLIRAVADGAVALELYLHSRAAVDELLDREKWKESVGFGRSSIVDDEVIDGFHELTREEQVRALRESWMHASLTKSRELWSEGKWPISYRHTAVGLHARSFIFALDTMRSVFKLLVRTADAPDEITSIQGEFLRAFADVEQVRHSLHHAEDRVRRKDRQGSNIDVKPIDVPGHIKTAGHSMFHESFTDDEFGGTAEDGEYRRVEVSGAALEKAAAFVQRTIYSFEWSGQGRYEPY